VNELVDNLQQLHFLRPQWLWVLALLPLAAWAWRRRRLQRSAWREAVDPHQLPHLLEAQPPRRERMPWWPALLAAALAVLALAGPSW
jgi:Ca-activated chloride channel family protein